MPIVSCKYVSESLTLTAKSLKKKFQTQSNSKTKKNPPKNNQTPAVSKKNELSNYITVSINADQK